MRARTWTGAMMIAAAVALVVAAAVVTRAGAREEVREIHLVARGMAFYLEADPATRQPHHRRAARRTRPLRASQRDARHRPRPGDRVAWRRPDAHRRRAGRGVRPRSARPAGTTRVRLPSPRGHDEGLSWTITPSAVRALSLAPRLSLVSLRSTSAPRRQVSLRPPPVLRPSPIATTSSRSCSPTDRTRRWKRRLIGMAGPLQCRRVLDLACGTGDIALLASAAAPTSRRSTSRRA